jgi:hypothetical protein
MISGRLRKMHLVPPPANDPLGVPTLVLEAFKGGDAFVEGQSLLCLARRQRRHPPKLSNTTRTTPNAPGVCAPSVGQVEQVVLKWHQFPKMSAARAQFPSEPCVYVQADRRGRAVRVGMASAEVNARYHGGTAYALDAAMHDSGNLVFVARVPMELVSAVEARLIYGHRGALPYNNVGKLHAPSLPLTLTHSGEAPVFA